MFQVYWSWENSIHKDEFYFMCCLLVSSQVTLLIEFLSHEVLGNYFAKSSCFEEGFPCVLYGFLQFWEEKLGVHIHPKSTEGFMWMTTALGRVRAGGWAWRTGLLAECCEAGQLLEAFQLVGLPWTGSELVVEPKQGDDCVQWQVFMYCLMVSSQITLWTVL